MTMQMRPVWINDVLAARMQLDCALAAAFFADCRPHMTRCRSRGIGAARRVGPSKPTQDRRPDGWAPKLSICRPRQSFTSGHG